MDQFITGTHITMIESLARNHGWDGSQNLYLWLSTKLREGREAISIVERWEDVSRQGR
ncbi:hypothetical protein CNR35_00077 [Pseudomonas phage inbricus]|uniref:Uncharacterized protein n=2 Tax=Inbricusvirus inbricus TaxID=2845970 RepID=A0A514CUS2_9CAUD|nr:hypothetical protein KMC58_gp74 [Pseudomonas phage inbricus]ATW58171.1 hypothetical protein CNR35_00077 [Pseudomonas phage inbricus]QDH84224.1 hypothetical protein Axy13_031 [Achromobacter phage vB_AxyP_19-32_Axy13]